MSLASEAGRVVVEICPESGRIGFFVEPWYESGRNLVRIWNEYVRNLAGVGRNLCVYSDRNLVGC